MIYTLSYEESLCRVCGTVSDCELVTAREMMFGSREEFTYALCSHCGALQIQSIPSDLERHYPPNYYSLQPGREPAPPSGLKGTAIRWYCRSAAIRPNASLERFLRSLLPVPDAYQMIGEYLQEAQLQSFDEKILDVGCGSSPRRLAAMKRCGFTACEGIDPFIPEDTEYAGVPVFQRTIDETQGQFGLIMFHHSLEHVPDPLSTLRSAARLLRPNGTCLIRIPLMGTYLWRRFGTNWVELDAPRHLHLMTKKSMNIIAEKAGFRVRLIRFDSEPWEIAASMLYERGIPLRTDLQNNSESRENLFTEEERSEFSRTATEINARGDAGRACFYLVKR